MDRGARIDSLQPAGANLRCRCDGRGVLYTPIRATALLNPYEQVDAWAERLG